MPTARSKTELRWGNKSRVDNDRDARERLLDAAEACLSRYGFAKTTVEDVAREARVSRSTFYRYFESRRDVVVAIFLREIAQIWDRAFSLIREQAGKTSFAMTTVDVILYAMEAVREGKYIPFLLNEEETSFTANAVTASPEFYAAAREAMGPMFEEAKAKGDVPASIGLDDYLEWHSRILFSLLMTEGPTKRNREETRQLLEMFVVPALTVGASAQRRSGRKSS